MKKLLAFLLSLIIMLSLVVTDTYALPDELSLSAESAVLIDAHTGDILYEKQSEKRMGMASTTKIMTALVAAESCDIDQTVDIPQNAVGIEGSSIYLYAGERFTVRELLYALLLRSANDAAAAIAIAIGGSIERFSDMMNAKAEELGLENTHFTNPHGLYEKEHYTSAYDLAVISSHLLKNETLKSIVSTVKITIPFGEATENTRLLVNHNKMLKTYEGAIGVKTGFTKATGRCLVSAAEREGLTLIAVTLNAPDDWRDHTEMLDFGFSRYESFTIAKPGAIAYDIPLVGGKKSTLTLTNSEELRCTLPKGSPKLERRIDTYHRFEFAPMLPNATLGRICYIHNGRIVASSPLVSAEFAEGEK